MAWARHALLRRLVGALAIVALVAISGCGGDGEETTSATFWVFRDDGIRPPSRGTEPAPDAPPDSVLRFATTTTFGTLPPLPMSEFDGAYCAALTEMWERTFLVFIGRNTDGTWPTFSEDLNGLADVVDTAADLAPLPHRPHLTGSADDYRRIAAKPWVEAQYEPLFNGGANLEYATDAYFNQVCLGQPPG
ncbi:MAG: hypothetical protein AAF467_13275 [Actinomycetota bacterium]